MVPFTTEDLEMEGTSISSHLGADSRQRLVQVRFIGRVQCLRVWDHSSITVETLQVMSSQEERWDEKSSLPKMGA